MWRSDTFYTVVLCVLLGSAGAAVGYATTGDWFSALAGGTMGILSIPATVAMWALGRDFFTGSDDGC